MSEITNASHDQEEYLNGHADGWSDAEEYETGDYIEESRDMESRYEDSKEENKGWAYHLGWKRGFLSYVESINPTSTKEALDRQALDLFRGYYAGRVYAEVEHVGGATPEQLYQIASRLDGTGFSGIGADDKSFNEDAFFEAISAPDDDIFDYLRGVRQGIYDYLELKGCDRGNAE